jgi:hypothetical protein
MTRALERLSLCTLASKWHNVLSVQNKGILCSVFIVALPTVQEYLCPILFHSSAVLFQPSIYSVTHRKNPMCVVNGV